jgi:hypothetical protein
VTELLLRDLSATRAVAFGNTGRYAAVATDDDRIHLWDLARIRSELAAIGLDW